MGLRLRQVRELRRVPLHELVPRLAELRTDEAGPVRKLVAEMIGEVGSKHTVYIPDVMPSLLDLLNDETPAVARQAVKTGTDLFAKVLQQLVIQGLFSSGGIDDLLKVSWEWMLKLKSAVSLMAFQWRARLLEAQNIINQGDSVDHTANDSTEHTANAARSIGDTSNRAESLPLTETSTDNSNKRNLADDMNNILEDDGHSSKRARQSHDAQEHSEETNKRNLEAASVVSSSNQHVPARTGNSEAVYQLISMFAPLAAQGDRAAVSLQILSSSIAADLLAEVVMVNMQHLPVSHPVDQQQPPSSSQSSIAPSLKLPSGRFPLLESLWKTIGETDQDEVPPPEESSPVTSAAGDTTPVLVSSPVLTTLKTPKEENSNSSEVPFNSSAVSLDIETIEVKVPGADAAELSIEVQESSETSHASTEPQGTQEHSGSFMSSLPADNSSVGVSLAQSSETRSPSSSTIEGSQSQFSSMNALTSQHVLPKLVVTNVDLTDEAKDLLQKEAFLRILARDKQEESCGSKARLPLLSHLGVEFPLELDPWALLQKHVLSDYVNNEAENLRDMFPASDKSLGKLLCEIPYLPEGVLKLLEDLCSPGNNEKQDKDLQSGDRVTQGLSAVWNLIMLRPSNRDRCLEIALQSSINRLDEVRMKAVRLVANKLFPVASISKRIEEFANEKLNSVLEVIPAAESASASEMVTPEAHQDGGLENLSSVADAQTLMSLYFALCTKKHSLLQRVFAIYGSLPQAAKQAVHKQVPILIRTIRSSTDLLGIISDAPADSRELLMQVVQTLTDGVVPSQDLISSVKNLYSKTKDVEFLFPVMAHLPKDEVMSVFPNIVNLPVDKFQVALSRILQGSPQHGPSLDPSEILIAIHVIDPEKEGIPLKKVIDACAACFEQRTIFTQQVLAKALNQLVEQIPLPLLFMRTVMQAIGAFPALVDFVMEIMSRLVSKQIWKYPKLWVGFLKCAILTKPQSYGVLLQLPAPQLENALNKNPVLKAPLVEHASQPNVRSTLPRSSLVVLGLAEDQQQPAPEAQSSQNQAAETSSSAADTTTEVTQESSAAS
ncbi:hypothetical protein ACQ4PT_058783 [Festuca glaucescens]